MKHYFNVVNDTQPHVDDVYHFLFYQVQVIVYEHLTGNWLLLWHSCRYLRT